MKNTLTWKKGVFESTYQLFSNDVLVGYLKTNQFTNSVECEMNSKKYHFKAKRSFESTVEIIDKDKNIPVGSIKFGFWHNKATIELNNKQLTWKFDNWWNTKWSLSDTETETYRYQGSQSKGSIEFNTENEILILSGLYIVHYIWQSSSLVTI